jgi:hypothetical protein
MCVNTQQKKAGQKQDFATHIKMQKNSTSIVIKTNSTPERRAQNKKWIQEWSRKTILDGLRRRIQESVEAAIQSGISDENILEEVKKAVRRSKRKRAKNGISESSPQCPKKPSPAHVKLVAKKSS